MTAFGTPAAARPLADVLRSEGESIARALAVPPTPEELRIIALEQEIAALNEAHQTALVQAKADARAEAERAFERDDRARIEALGGALTEAVSAFEENLTGLETLSLALCETALTGIFETPHALRELVTEALGRQLAEIRRESILAISVSAGDFADADALQELARRYQGLVINTDPGLTPGACRIALRLGQVELSVPEYWRALKSRLAQLAGEA